MIQRLGFTNREVLRRIQQCIEEAMGRGAGQVAANNNGGDDDNDGDDYGGDDDYGGGYEYGGGDDDECGDDDDGCDDYGGGDDDECGDDDDGCDDYGGGDEDNDVCDYGGDEDYGGGDDFNGGDDNAGGVANVATEDQGDGDGRGDNNDCWEEEKMESSSIGERNAESAVAGGSQEKENKAGTVHVYVCQPMCQSIRLCVLMTDCLSVCLSL